MIYFAMPIYLLAAGYMFVSALRIFRVAALRWRGQPHGKHDIDFAVGMLLVGIALQCVANAIAAA